MKRNISICKIFIKHLSKRKKEHLFKSVQNKYQATKSQKSQQTLKQFVTQNTNYHLISIIFVFNTTTLRKIFSFLPYSSKK